MPTFYPYQLEGSERLAESGGYLADDPGLGKSAQIVRATDLLDSQRNLILCPASLKVNWAREFSKFSVKKHNILIPGARDTVPLTGPLTCIVNYDITVKPLLHRQLLDGNWDVLAGDEWHALKNPESSRTRAVLGDIGLYKAARHVWPVSGTPMPNHPGELYATLLRLAPAALRDEDGRFMDYAGWLRYYCHVVEGDYGPRVKGFKPGKAHLLKNTLQDFFIRRRRAEVLPDLPELRVSELTIAGGDALAQLSVDARLEYPELDTLLGAENASEEELEALDDTALSTLRKLCGMAKAAPLAEQVRWELDSGMKKVVIMCWHHTTMDILHAALQDYGVARIDGKTKDRQKEVDRFQSVSHTTNCRVFIGQIVAAGVGNTLTAASDMIIAEPSWVPGENAQAMFRIHRIGQQDSCLVRFAQLEGSIDMAIMAVQKRKAELVAEILL